MKKYSFSFILLIITLFLSIVFVQCNSATKDNTSAVKETEVPMATTVIEAKVDTETLFTDTLAIKEPDVIIAPITTKSKINTKVTTIPKHVVILKPSESKPVEVAKESLATTVTPILKETNVEVVSNAPKPEVATKAPITKAPATLTLANFSLKSVKAVVIGTSSLHAWESQITQIEGEGSFELKDSKIVAIKDMEVKIGVKGIKSKEGKKMDNKTYETFNSDKNPFIIYAFSNAQVKMDASNAVTIEAAGNLSMAGTTKPVQLTAKGNVLPNGDLKLSVSQKLKMTEFNMEPPTMLLGTIKVGDEITVEFDLVLTAIKTLN